MLWLHVMLMLYGVQAQVAGGSGLTPMLQIASEVLRNPDDKTEARPHGS